MTLWRDRILPHVVDKTCGRADLAELRRRLLTGLSGDVVEIGFGTGHNLPHLPEGVDRVLAVEPSPLARRLAEPRIADSPVTVEFAGLDGEHVALPDGCADGAVSTFTLCTIPDATRALRELARVLRPGGRLHFLEHGLSPNPKVARWQHRLTPLQRRICGGCHFDRRIDELLTGAGFEVLTLDHPELAGPDVGTYLYVGVAAPA